MRVLVACEESQVVTKAFRTLGMEAFSCDILPCSGGHPEWHLQQDVIPLLKEPWDLVIAFPPCTHLAISGARWFKSKSVEEQDEAIRFFLSFINLNCPYAIENSLGIMSTRYEKPTQIVHPWWFGHDEKKATCLWLKGLPRLKPTKIVFPTQATCHETGPSKERSKKRSKTFEGLANAMAQQWGLILKEKLCEH